ncbi:MAG: hypothetical protein JWN78_115 [Bacteroidota bacterium]|nr:hypothetical protein [Bacteroidota bacterium]
MENNNEKTVEVLNTLIEINNDRIQGYLTAAKETREMDLKDLFGHLAHDSQKCKQELADEVTKLHGTPTEGTKTTGKIYRAWMDVKAALTNNDRKAIIDCCEYGEDVAKETYENVLKDDGGTLTATQRQMVTEQYNLIRNGHDKIKALKDTLVEH